jgi:hypothetical protein
MPRAAEHRMIGDIALNAEPAKPLVRRYARLTCTSAQIRRSVGSQSRSQRSASGAPGRSTVGRCASSCKLLVYPAQSERRIDLPNQMIRGHHLCRDQTRKGIGPLAAPLCTVPANRRLIVETESPFAHRLNESFATQSPQSGHARAPTVRPPRQRSRLLSLHCARRVASTSKQPFAREDVMGRFLLAVVLTATMTSALSANAADTGSPLVGT